MLVCAWDLVYKTAAGPDESSGGSLLQGLPDHAHVPTLEVLPRHIPVVANPAAAKIVEGLGYTNITVLEHGESASLANGRLLVTAVEGARLAF